MMWKNGVGTTSQIDIVPQGSSFPNSDFSWRLSSAIVREPQSTFSNFVGCTRILAVWEGPGLVLNKSLELNPLGKPQKFEGEEPMFCQTLRPPLPVVDYGIIFQRGICDAEMGIISFPEGNHHLSFDKSGVHYITSAIGEFELGDKRVSKGDTLKIEVAGLGEENEVVKIRVEGHTTLFHVHVHLI